MGAFDDKLITSGLAELGYRRLRRLTYKASWSSTDVEHFLFFSLYRRRVGLGCEFGIRNPAAQRFALECMKLFGGQIFETLRYDPRSSCSMQFSLGELAGWDRLASLDILKMSEETLADEVKRAVRNSLFPVICSISSVADLFSLLIEDTEPFRWFKVSGAIRAAMIVYLGRRMGMQTDDIKAMLQPYLKEIGANIGLRSMMYEGSPSGFLEKVLHYAN